MPNVYWGGKYTACMHCLTLHACMLVEFYHCMVEFGLHGAEAKNALLLPLYHVGCLLARPVQIAHRATLLNS